MGALAFVVKYFLKLSWIIFFGWSVACPAQVTFRILTLPDATPADARIYISGSFEGWSGGQPAYELRRDQESNYLIELPQMQGSIQYKFTRGDWTTVEKGTQGEEIANHNYTFGGNGDIVDHHVLSWAEATVHESTAAENVFIMDEDFQMPALARSRRIWVYLPPDYAVSQERYPVLYMHDGQNLFDDLTSFSGEWGVDETLNSLYDQTGFGLIVIGIENGGAHRIDEYSPWFEQGIGGGEGATYVDWIVKELKPYVDSAYRTMPEPASTGLMGSSMGGLISQYGGIAAPEVFQKIGVFSPTFRRFDQSYMQAANTGVDPAAQYYYLAGGLEPGVAESVYRMRDTMLSAGATPAHIQVHVVPEGMHNEPFWRSAFGSAILWLFADFAHARD